MSVLEYPFSAPTYIDADIVVYDKSDNLVLLGEVKADVTNRESALRELTRLLQSSPSSPQVRLGLLADKHTTQFFEWNGRQLSEPLATLSTPDIVLSYDPEFLIRPASENAVATLLAAWLRDFIYHWKSSEPPAKEVIQNIGLGSLLSGGAVFTNN